MPPLPCDESARLWCQLCSSRGAIPGEAYCDECSLLRPRYLDAAPPAAGDESALLEVRGLKGVRSGWSAMEYLLIAMLLAVAAALLASGP